MLVGRRGEPGPIAGDEVTLQPHATGHEQDDDDHDGDQTAVAGALQAEKLVILTDVKGIKDEDGKLVSTLARKDVARMVKKGTISEGMLPKVQACLTALEGGVRKTHVIDGRMPHAILLEIFTDKGIGTEIVA